MKRTIIICSLFAIFLAGCYPKGPEFVSDYDISAAVQAEGYDFDAVKTYSMPDSIFRVTDKEDQDFDTQYDQEILNQIEAGFAALGLDRVPEDNATAPDVVVVVSTIVITNSGYVPGWCDWYGYWPGWGYWPGYCYGGYPGYTYSYDVGTLNIVMVDPDEATDDPDEVPVVWDGAVNGLLSGGSNGSRIETGIDRLFTLYPTNN